jgi:transmembrane sensor
MDKQRLQQLIDKVLSGRASAQEQQELDDWYVSQGDGAGLTEQLEPQDKNALGKKLFQNIEQRVQSTQYEPESIAPVHYLPVQKSYGKWIAAAVILLVLAAGAFYFFTNQPATPAAIAAVWKEQKTGTAVQDIRLPDGSQVWLNAGSSIRYDSNFVNGKREIWLEGEAYFDVTHIEGKPFEVHTGKLTTRVLGTAFNIDAYAPAGDITVTVKRGKVTVTDSVHESGILLPDQMVTYTQDGSFTRDSVVSNNSMAWTSGEFVFDEMKFSEVTKRLERQFKVALLFKDKSIGDCRITASFSHNTPLKDMLEMIAITNGSKVLPGENPQTFYISGKKQCK